LLDYLTHLSGFHGVALQSCGLGLQQQRRSPPEGARPSPRVRKGPQSWLKRGFDAAGTAVGELKIFKSALKLGTCRILPGAGSKTDQFPVALVSAKLKENAKHALNGHDSATVLAAIDMPPAKRWTQRSPQIVSTVESLLGAFTLKDVAVA